MNLHDFERHILGSLTGKPAMQQVREDRDEKVAKTIIDRGHKVRAEILTAHLRAWDDSTALGMVQALGEQDLTCVLIVAQIGARAGRPLDERLLMWCDDEDNRRDLLTEGWQAA